MKRFVVFSVLSLLSWTECCYYNHELSVAQGGSESDLLIKWRDVPSGPFPGTGMQFSLDDLVFELEAEDLTAVSVGKKKFEISVPQTFGEVQLHEKSLCDWGFGCAHCEHVSAEVCTRRLSVLEIFADNLPSDVPAEIPPALKEVSDSMTKLCSPFVVSGMGKEKYSTNEVVEACSAECLDV